MTQYLGHDPREKKDRQDDERNCQIPLFAVLAHGPAAERLLQALIDRCDRCDQTDAAALASVVPEADWSVPHIERSSVRWRSTNVAPIATAAHVEATRALMDEIARLLGELRGETPPAERWDPAAHGQSEYGKFTPPTR